MFSLNHTAICVSDIEKSTKFYELFGFKQVKFKEWDDGKSACSQLKLGNNILEFHYRKVHSKIPATALDIATDLSVIGTKHFALSVDDINKAKEFCLKNKIKISTDIRPGKLGKAYFFITDPDGIQVEIIEN